MERKGRVVPYAGSLVNISSEDAFRIISHFLARELYNYYMYNGHGKKEVIYRLNLREVQRRVAKEERVYLTVQKIGRMVKKFLHMNGFKDGVDYFKSSPGRTSTRYHIILREQNLEILRRRFIM